MLHYVHNSVWYITGGPWRTLLKLNWSDSQHWYSVTIKRMYGSNARSVAKSRRSFKTISYKACPRAVGAAHCVAHSKECLHSPWSEVNCIASGIVNAFSLYFNPGAQESNVLKNYLGQIKGKTVIIKLYGFSRTLGCPQLCWLQRRPDTQRLQEIPDCAYLHI